MNIDYEELREKAKYLVGALQRRYETPIEAEDVIDLYEEVLQSYLSDKLIIPLEMIREAREEMLNHNKGCFLRYTADPCDWTMREATCRLCKLLTKASHRGKE